jgi:hypothetical protein
MLGAFQAVSQHRRPGDQRRRSRGGIVMTNQTVAVGSRGPADAASAEKALRLIAIIAVLSIGLGFVMQGSIVLIKMAGGGAFPGLQLLVDITQGVTWSFLVCAGVGIGTTVMKARPVIVGLIGFICAPIGMAAAKGAQKGMAALIGSPGGTAVLSLSVIASLRAVEYAVLAWILATLVRKGTAGGASYIGAGAATGVVFGSGIAMLTFVTAGDKGITLALPQILATVFNEVGFPIGCAIVIYISQVVGRNMKLISG